MDEEMPTFRGRVSAGVTMLFFMLPFGFCLLNQPVERIASACGIVASVRGVQGEGPTIRWLGVQPESGDAMEVRAPPEVLAMPGDAVCWHTYRRRFAGTSQLFPAVPTPAK